MTSVHDLAHAKGVPTAAREAMLLMQERIAELEAENERILAGSRDNKLHFDVLKADYDRQDAVIAGLVEELMQIEVDAMEYYNQWCEDGCDSKEAIRFAFDLGANARQALAKAKESRDD